MLKIILVVLLGLWVFTFFIKTLAGILGFLSLSQKMPAFPEESMLKTILSRKSVRKYAPDKEVTDAQIKCLLMAGMAAPSAKNLQPWKFIVIKEKAALKRLSEKIDTARMLDGASCAIIVLGNMDKVQTRPQFWQQDTAAATENILLETESLGLGAVWIGVYPVEERVNVVKEECNLPDNILPLNIISIGYPLEKEMPKNKWNEENIHYEKY